MPTLGSADAFTKVVNARNELQKIAAELSVACDKKSSTDTKYPELKKRLRRARQDFALAINIFSATRNGTGG